MILFKDKKLYYIFEDSFLDGSKVESLEKEILSAVDRSNCIVFDMRNVKYISSAFINLCITAVKIFGKMNLSIINCGEFVEEIFRKAGLYDKFNFK